MELNPFVAFTAHTKSNYEIGFPQSIIPIEEQFKLNDKIRGGLRFNVNTTGHWGEEVFFSTELNKAHFIKKTAPARDQVYDIRIYNFGANVMYYLNEAENQHTRPFLSAGLGGTVYQPTAHSLDVANDPLRGNTPGFESSTELAFNYGIGLKQSLGDPFGLRLDAR